MVGRGDMHGVDIRAAEHVAKIAVHLAIFVIVLMIDAPLGAFAGTFFHVANGDVLHVGPTDERAQVVVAAIADADAGHDDPLAGGRLAAGAEGRRSDDIGATDRGGGRRGGCQKVSSIRGLLALFHKTMIPSVEAASRKLPCTIVRAWRTRRDPPITAHA